MNLINSSNCFIIDVHGCVSVPHCCCNSMLGYVTSPVQAASDCVDRRVMANTAAARVNSDHLPWQHSD